MCRLLLVASSALVPLFQLEAQQADVGVLPQAPPPREQEAVFPQGLTPADMPADALFMPPVITASAGVVPRGPVFELRKDDRRFGPYFMDEGATVGSGQSRYEITLVENGTFSLKSLTQQRFYGPFAFTDGAPCEIGQAAFTIGILPNVIMGRILSQRLTHPSIAVHLIHMTPVVFRELLAVRLNFGRFETEVRQDTARVRLRTPTISGPTGVNRSQVIEPSQRDVERANLWASQRARTTLERYIKQCRPHTVHAVGANKGFMFQVREPGVYAVCVLTTARPSDPRAAVLSESILWWAHVRLLEGSAEIEFDENNAIEWNQLFLRP